MVRIKEEGLSTHIDSIRELVILRLENDPDLSSLYDELTADLSLYVHSNNVARYSCALGMQLGLELRELTNLFLGALLHDIGKVRLNKSVLYKESRLDDLEKAHIEAHSFIGYKLLKHTSLEKRALNIVKMHHEKLDGSGYPDHTRGENLSELVQIVTVADMFDAMTTDRCYRIAMTKDEAFDILRADKGVNQIYVRLLEGLIEENKDTEFVIDCNNVIFLTNMQ